MIEIIAAAVLSVFLSGLILRIKRKGLAVLLFIASFIFMVELIVPPTRLYWILGGIGGYWVALTIVCVVLFFSLELEERAKRKKK